MFKSFDPMCVQLCYAVGTGIDKQRLSYKMLVFSCTSAFQTEVTVVLRNESNENEDITIFRFLDTNTFCNSNLTISVIGTLLS